MSKKRLQKTALYDQHQLMGAKWAPFHGWQMPIHYGSQVAEHHQVRRHCGVFDVSHMLVCDLRLQTQPSQDLEVIECFLNRVLTNDLARLNITRFNHEETESVTDISHAQYTLMLNEHGGVLDDLIVYRLSTGFRLVLNCGRAEEDLAWLQLQRNTLSDSTQIDILPRRDLSILALQGPGYEQYLPNLLPAQLAKAVLQLKPFEAVVEQEVMLARTGYTGEPGIELMLPHDQAISLWQHMMALEIQPCGLGARDTLRLEAGYNLYGQDMTNAHHPFESNVGWTVAMQKAFFIGQDALREQMRGSEYVMVGVRYTGKGVLRAGFKLYEEDRVVGNITSGSYSPTFGVSIGLARVKRSAYELSKTAISVLIRNTLQPVDLVKPGSDFKLMHHPF